MGLARPATYPKPRRQELNCGQLLNGWGGVYMGGELWLLIQPIPGIREAQGRRQGMNLSMRHTVVGVQPVHVRSTIMMQYKLMDL
jgi:hypothetical protein